MYARLKSLFFIVACLSMLPVYGAGRVERDATEVCER